MAESYYNSSLTAEQIEATLLGSVRGDATQNKTAAWKTKARQNIGAAGADDVIAVAKGGTGGTTAAAARANLGLGTAAVADLDNTLAVSGAAAEAKRVGDLFDAVFEQFTDRAISATFVQGAISSSSGSNNDSDSRLRTNLYHKVSPSLGLKVEIPDGFKVFVFGYSSASPVVYVGAVSDGFVTGANEFRNLDSRIRFVRFVLAKVGDAAITPSEVPSGLALIAVEPTDTSLSLSGKAADAEAVGDAIYYKSGDVYANTRDSSKPTNFPGIITGTSALSFTVFTNKTIPVGMTATVTRLANVRIYGSNGYVGGSSSVNMLTSGYTVTTAVRGPNLVTVFINKDTDFSGAVVGSCIVANVSLVLTFS